MTALWPTSRAVMSGPFWVVSAFQRLVICWSPAKANVSVHPLTAVVPVLVTVRLAVNPSDQVLGA